MGFHIVRYDDVGATSFDLNGTVNSLIDVLDYCLVTISGWTKVFSGTNKAAYQYTTGHPILRVDDTGSISNARVAYLRAYESMTDIDTGINPFPTTTQSTNGYIVLKSTVLDSSERVWNFFTKDGSFYFNNRPLSGDGRCYTFFFGEFIKYKSTDSHNFVLIGPTATDHATYASGGFYATNNVGKVVKRGLDGVTTSVSFFHIVCNYGAYDEIGSPIPFTLTYPNPADGGLYISPVEIHYDASICGRVPGYWIPRHDSNVFVEGDTFTATINGQSRTFEFINSYSDYTRRPLIVETSDTWLI